MSNLFDFVNNLYSKRAKFPEESEVSSLIWPINRMLSMEQYMLETVAYTSKYMFTLGAKYYRLLWRVIPQTNAPRNKYLKPEADDNGLIDRYVQYFKLSRREVRDYLRLLRKDLSQKEIYEFVGLEQEKKK
jgi:hypothetical protein